MRNQSPDLESTVFSAFVEPDRLAILAAKIGSNFRGACIIEMHEAIASVPEIAETGSQLVAPFPRPVESALRAWEVSYSGRPIQIPADSQHS